MTIGIYGIFDVRDDSCLYVGQSKVIEERWKGHLSKLKLGKHLRSEFNEHFREIGRDKTLLDFRVIEECEDLNSAKNALEIKWFNLLEPRFYGKKPTMNGKWSHSKETKAKISKGLANSELFRSQARARIKTKDQRICIFCGNSFNSNKLKTCSNQCSRDLISRNMTVITEVSYDNLYQLWVIDDASIESLAAALGCSTTSAYRIIGDQNLPTKKKEVTQLRKALGLETEPTRQCLVCPNEVTSSNKRAKTCSSVCRYKLRDITTVENRNPQLV